MAPFDRRDFSGNSVPTTTTSTIDNDDLTINITNATGWPDGDVGPFIVTLDKGLSTEEKVEVASRTGLVLTVTATGRGHDGTAATSHGAGSPIEHTLAARDVQEANQHIADDSLDHHSQYLNPVRHAAEVHSIATGELENEAVTYAKLAQGQRWEPGDFKFGIQAADHAGWLLCDGRAVAIATYANLFAAMGGHIFAADPGSGNFRLPDLRKRYLAGKSASGVGSTLGGSFGTADNNVVQHSHTINSHVHSTGGNNVGHTHASENHNHWVNGVGDHTHIVNAGGHEVAFLFGGANGGLRTDANAERITFSDVNPAGAHDHGWTGGHANHSGGQQGESQGHNHGNTGDASDRGTNLIGTSGTDANLPPSIAVNGFIHV